MTQSVSVASRITPTSVTVIAIIVLILGLPMVVKPQLEMNNEQAEEKQAS
jgi:hypothetical protein